MGGGLRCGCVGGLKGGLKGGLQERAERRGELAEALTKRDAGGAHLAQEGEGAARAWGELGLWVRGQGAFLRLKTKGAQRLGASVPSPLT